MVEILNVSYIALWILVLVQGALLLLVYRHFGIAALSTFEGVQRDGIEIGASAQPVNATSLTGDARRWVPEPSRMQLLMFLSADCEPCGKVTPFLNDLDIASRKGAGLRVTAIVSGGVIDLQRFVGSMSPTFECLADDGLDAIKEYRVRVTPFGFVIGEDGRVLAKGLCSDHDKLQRLLNVAGVHDVVLAPNERMDISQIGRREVMQFPEVVQ